MKKKELFFDMDGTLWDSAANVAESWNLCHKNRMALLIKTDGAGYSGGYGKDHGCDRRHSFSRNWKKRCA